MNTTHVGRVPQTREAWRTIVTTDLAGAAQRLVRLAPLMSDDAGDSLSPTRGRR